MRLHNQMLLQPKLTDPQEVISYLTAMQAQEYAMAKWAIALRMPEADQSSIEKDFNEGRILRTHILRPTWHFVAPQDIYWLLQLSAPRVSQANASVYRGFGLDEKIFTKTNKVMEKALRDNNYLTRDAIREELAKAGIAGGDSIGMSLIMMQAELTGLIISGPRKGNKFTYALLEERAPKTKAMGRDEALAMFCRRYYKSRGPASIKDFTAWSGLTVKEAKEGVALLGKELETINVDGMDYYFMDNGAIPKKGQDSFLMPDYDEYGMGYKDRSVLINPDTPARKLHFDRVIILNGMVAGTWKRTLKKDTVRLDIQLYDKSQMESKAFTDAVNKYANFLQLKPELNFI